MPWLVTQKNCTYVSEIKCVFHFLSGMKTVVWINKIIHKLIICLIN